MWEMTLKEPRPCPFCQSQETEKQDGQQISCSKCEASAPSAMWNNRPLEDRLVASALKLSIKTGHMAFGSEYRDGES